MKITAVLKLMITQPKRFVESVLRYPPIAKKVSDRTAISILYFMRFKRRIDLDDPKSFNEKLLWLTLYDRKPEYSRMVDKYEAKGFLYNKLAGGGYSSDCIIPTYGIYNSFDEIDFDILPDSFVIKTTHDSGGVVVVENKACFDKDIARLKIEDSLKRNYYWFSREWVYKDVKPRIIVEKKLVTKEKSPIDYKIFCFNGKSKYLYLVQDRDIKETVDYYDMDWNHLPIKQVYDNNTKTGVRPDCWPKMIEVAEYISKGIPFLRVDFYVDVKGDYYIGELTFVPSSGLLPITPYEWDLKIGESIVLPLKE